MRINQLRKLKSGCKDKSFVLLGVEKEKNELLIFDHDLYVVRSLMPRMIAGPIKKRGADLEDFRVLRYQDLKELEMNLVEYRVSYQIVYFLRKKDGENYLGNHQVFVKGSYNFHYDNDPIADLTIPNRENRIVVNNVKIKDHDDGYTHQIINNDTLYNNKIAHSYTPTIPVNDNNLSRIIPTDKSSLEAQVSAAKMHQRRSYSDKHINDKPTSRENRNAIYGDFYRY